MGIFFLGVNLVLLLFIIKLIKKIMAKLTDFQAQLDSINASIEKISANAEGSLSSADSAALLTAITEVANRLATIAG